MREISSGAPELSGGERQWLALARALFHRPELLILDETTSYVDAELERKLIELARRRLPESAVLVFSHRERVGALADRRLRLDAGGLASWDRCNRGRLEVSCGRELARHAPRFEDPAALAPHLNDQQLPTGCRTVKKDILIR